MFNLSKLKDMEILYVVLGAAAILVIGWLLIKIIVSLAKKLFCERDLTSPCTSS